MAFGAQRQLARAKLNLFLRIHGRRSDGYHFLESLVAFADIGDDIMVTPAEEVSLIIDGPFAGPLRTDATENIVLKATRLLGSQAGDNITPPCIRLVKNLPVASGIGGGSADAAATLKALCALWHLDTEVEALALLGKELGADVPVCLFGEAAIMRGIGEIITPAPLLPPLWVVLVNPGEALSTAKVFAALKARPCEVLPPPLPLPQSFSDANELVAYLSVLGNDLEIPACAILPSIDTMLDELDQTGALLSRMSGSGATCFGLFESATEAQSAEARIAQAYPRWWVVAAALRRHVSEPQYWRHS